MCAGLREALAGAAERIERFAREQREAFADVTVREGNLELGHRLMPLERAGIYVPAGRHPLPSSLLMGAIPAAVAGVRERIVCTPRAVARCLPPRMLPASTAFLKSAGRKRSPHLPTARRAFRASTSSSDPGTPTLPQQNVRSSANVRIDALAGPSEIAIVASGDAEADLVAADLLAQAEHDDDARALLITDDRAFALAVSERIDARLASLSTRETARRLWRKAAATYSSHSMTHPHFAIA